MTPQTRERIETDFRNKTRSKYNILFVNYRFFYTLLDYN